MSLEVAIQRSKDEVTRAIMQFAGRRNCRLTQPWYVEGTRLEIPPTPSQAALRRATSPLPPWADAIVSVLVDRPSDPPRVDVRIHRRKSRTIVSITLGKNRESLQLAYALQSYLLDERTYAAASPANCRHCTAPVTSVAARFCGRCGRRLFREESIEDAPPPMPAALPRPVTESEPPVRRPAATPEPDASALERPAAARTPPTPEPAATVEPAVPAPAAGPEAIAEAIVEET